MSVKPTEQIILSAQAFHALRRAAGREGVSPDYIVELLVCWFLEDRDGRPFRAEKRSVAGHARPFKKRRHTLTIDPVSSWPDSTHTISPDAAKRSTECPHCHEPVTLKQRRVFDAASLYHLSCFEVWYFGQFARLPRLRLRVPGDPKQYETVSSRPA
jgi:hypothetical protein